jgi:hypothetical protein
LPDQSKYLVARRGNTESTRFRADRDFYFDGATAHLAVFNILLTAARNINKRGEGFSAEGAANFGWFFH